MSDAAEARRKARAHWRTRLFRGDEISQMEAADDAFWQEIPLGERAKVVWELSEELFSLTDPESRERRLPRSAFRVVRR